MTDADLRPIGRLLHAQQSAEPDRLLDTLAEAVSGIGAQDVVLYLIDYEQSVLIPHPATAAAADGSPAAPVPVEGSMPGRVFQSAGPLAVQREDGLAGVGSGARTRQQARGVGVAAAQVG